MTHSGNVELHHKMLCVYGLSKGCNSGMTGYINLEFSVIDKRDDQLTKKAILACYYYYNYCCFYCYHKCYTTTTTIIKTTTSIVSTTKAEDKRQNIVDQIANICH